MALYLSLIYQDPPCLSASPHYSVVSLGFPISTGKSTNSLGLLSVLPHPCCLSCHDPLLAYPFPVWQLKLSSALLLQCFLCVTLWKLSKLHVLLAPRNTLQLSVSFMALARSCCVICSSVSFRMEQLFCIWGQVNAKRKEEGRNSYRRRIKPCMCSVVGKERG